MFIAKYKNEEISTRVPFSKIKKGDRIHNSVVFSRVVDIQKDVRFDDGLIVELEDGMIWYVPASDPARRLNS
tara:strand:- start:1438 stop:1653 length:216 start_codon:yes stop_codon:yes gene_type:complete